MFDSPKSKDHKFFSLYYENDGFNIKGEKLMGRQAAGWSFLKSIISSNRYDTLGVYLRNINQKELLINDIKSILTKDNSSIEIRSIPFIEPNLTSEFGGIQLPGPNIVDFANHRSFFGHHSYSLCGLTHTTASYDVMNSFSSLLTHPIMPWDAIICSSQSVLNTVNKIIDIQSDFLKNRIAHSKKILPQLPVIPLGINTDEFNFTDSYKNDSRNRLKIDKNDIVISYVGRLSFHAKAHHLPMYLALEKISKQLKNNQKLHLIQTGWFASDYIENSFRNEAKLICPSVNCIFLDGRDPVNKSITLASSDIFMSLSDNIQETFGLTPLEAMASELPVIVSDWDGYRSTVRDSIDGYRVSSYTLGEGFGEDLMFNYMMGVIDYDNYIGGTVHKVGIDVKECIDKLSLLIESSDLRKEFGSNGRKRAISDFSWIKILDRYEELYKELDDIRTTKYSKYLNISTKTLPSNRQDPFKLFSDYSSSILELSTKIKMAKDINKFSLSEILDLSSIKYTDFLPSKNDLSKVITCFNDDKELRISDIINLSKLDKDKVFNTTIFLLKYGYIYIEEKKNE
tara:strand:+ start:326 stop:2032 length:1707 start_codon:yes stop_codon:yes gene_type:complete